LPDQPAGVAAQLCCRLRLISFTDHSRLIDGAGAIMIACADSVFGGKSPRYF
jgi:hypothetical protein